MHFMRVCFKDDKTQSSCGISGADSGGGGGQADPGFQVRGAHLKKLRRTEGGGKIFGVFRVKNHDFTPKNPIFPILGGGARNFWGISSIVVVYHVHFMRVCFKDDKTQHSCGI
jgi:hypothetical protein